MFKTGDKVICIDCESSKLNEGVIYTIKKTYGNNFVWLDEIDYGPWMIYRFKQYNYRKEKLKKILNKK